MGWIVEYGYTTAPCIDYADEFEFEFQFGLNCELKTLYLLICLSISSWVYTCCVSSRRTIVILVATATWFFVINRPFSLKKSRNSRRKPAVASP
jgi:hypothetical protein